MLKSNKEHNMAFFKNFGNKTKILEYCVQHYFHVLKTRLPSKYYESSDVLNF